MLSEKAFANQGEATRGSVALKYLSTAKEAAKTDVDVATAGRAA